MSANTTALDSQSIADISRSLNALLADSFALYLKTKNFHWRAGGVHFPAYRMSHYLEFEEHAEQLFASTDGLAARVRAMGGPRLSLGEIGQLRRVRENQRRFVPPQELLGELADDNEAILNAMQEARELCERHRDAASLSLLETLIDQTERRNRFLLQMRGDVDGE